LLLQKAAAALPLWLGGESGDEEPPPLSGCIPAATNHVMTVGDLVAARVKPATGDDNWILAEVGKIPFLCSISI